MTMLADALALLGLSPEQPATPDQTKRAYLRKLREHPPERDPEGFQRLREAYELVKYGWDPCGDDAYDDDRNDDDSGAHDHDHVNDVHGHDHSTRDHEHDDHVSDVHGPGHATLDLGHFRAHRSAPAGLDGHVVTLLRHLEHGDVVAARACERARPEFSVARTDRTTALRYLGARELLDLAEQLPGSAIVAYACALMTYAPGATSPVLAAHWDTRSGDARRALWVLRHRSDSVLRELAMAAEPRTWRIYHWFADYDQTWAQLAFLGLAIVIGIILQQCSS